MVNVIEDSENQNQAFIRVYCCNKIKKKSLTNFKFEEWIHKDRTVRQLMNLVSMFYGLNVNSIYLILNSYYTDFIPETKVEDKLKLEVDDDRLLSDLGIIFNQVFHYNFVLYENDQAQCLIDIPEKNKYYQLTVDKNTTASQLYKKALKLCQNENFSTDSFILTFNFYRIVTSRAGLVKLKLTEDDSRLLSDIGVVFGQRIKNRFEVSLNTSSFNVDGNTTNDSCLLKCDQKTESQSSKLYSEVQNTPVLSVPRMQFPKSTEKLSKFTGYRGLVNQALTCYLNSFLQVLYMTPEFRNALYNWEFDPSVNSNTPDSSIPFQLQKLFLNLQTSPLMSVETKELTRSFGWNAQEVCQQNDIQEFCRAMMDSLENELRNTTHADLINELYQGQLIDNVKCLECGVEKSKEVSFLDIPLSIRPIDSTIAYTSILEALQGFIQSETLEGDNQYYCDRCNKKCDAHKNFKFSKFPYILTLYLKRFAYDNTFKYTKLNDKVVFPFILNLNNFVSNTAKTQENQDPSIHDHFDELGKTNSMCGDGSYIQKGSSSELDEINQNEEESVGKCSDEDEEYDVSLNVENEPVEEPYMYDLYAIIIHLGNVSEGHYYAYIKDFKTNRWLCFNDQLVSEITMDDIEKSFGGRSIDDSNQQVNSSNAYMLMYRQIDPKRNKNAMSQEEFPPHIKDFQNVLQKKVELIKQLKDNNVQIFKVEVYLMNCDLMKLFFCRTTITIDQLKTKAIRYFGVTKPCQLVIYNKITQKVVEELEHKSNCLVYNLKYHFPNVLLLQIVDSKCSLSTLKNILMKLFIIESDRSVENVNFRKPYDIEVEQNKLIEDLSILLYTKYNIPHESKLHFAIPNSSEPFTILEPTVECISVHSNIIFVFVEHNTTSQLDIMQKMKTVFKRYDTVNNTIQIQFVLPSKNTEVSPYSTVSCLINSMDSEKKHMSSLEDLNKNSLDDDSISTKDSVTSPGDLLGVAIGNGSGDQCEDSNTDNERIINNTVQDNLMDSSINKHDPLKVYDEDRLDKSYMNDIKADKELKSNEKYMFLKLDFKSIWDETSKNDNDTFYAFIDKRMTVNELKYHLVSHTNIQSDLIILKRYISENKFEELDFPSRSLEDLNNHEIIHISIGAALHKGQYRGTIFLLEYLEQTQIIMKEMFSWIIKVGTSVLETKKELIAQLCETQNIDIPLERCRLRKKKKSALLQCYFNEEIWNEEIGQGWEMVILDLKDRSEIELDKMSKRLIFVNHVENNDSQECKISEMEFVIEIASTTSISTQLVKEISTKFNFPEDQIELGYMQDDSADITWQRSVTLWSFDFFDYVNSVLFFRFVDETTFNKKVPCEQSYQRRSNSLNIGIIHKNERNIG